MNICLQLHLSESTLARVYTCQNELLSEIPSGRNYINPKTYFPEFTLARINVWLKSRFPENSFAELTLGRICLRPKLHLPKNLFS